MKRKHTIRVVVALSNYSPIFGQTIQIATKKRVIWIEEEVPIEKKLVLPNQKIPKPFLMKRIGNYGVCLVRKTKKIIKQPQKKKNDKKMINIGGVFYQKN